MSAHHEFSKEASPRLPTTFLDLSRELRDHCYSFALTTPVPIIAWSGIRPESQDSDKAKCIFDVEDNVIIANNPQIPVSRCSNPRDLSLNLFQCNSKIGYEAALVFYGKNKFLFADDWTWDTVVTWFESIGPRNRNFVSSIELRMVSPSRAWQQPDGQRVEVIYALEPPFPRNRHLFRSPETTSEGVVETINPAIETFFELVGNNDSPCLSKLLITFALNRGLLPGSEIVVDDSGPQFWFGTDVPNVVEKLRAAQKCRHVEVIWTGCLLRDQFDERRADNKTRWEILSQLESKYTTPPRILRDGRKRDAIHRWYLLFTLRSKSTVMPLFAEEPSPYSNWGF